MRWSRSVLSVVLSFALLGGCGGKKDEAKKAVDESAESGEASEGEPECEVDDDCYKNEICLDGECTSTASGQVYTNPRRAVTPAKVKREVEKRLQQGQDRRDEYIEGTE